MPDLPEARAAFIETIGLIAQAEGMPRSAGRLFGLLVFDGTEHSFGKLAEDLQISRGNVSASVRILEERDLVMRVAKAGDRQDYFRLADNPFPSLLRNAQARTGRAAREIEKSLDALPVGADGQRARLQDYANFYHSIVAGLGHAVTEFDTSASARQPIGDKTDV